MLKVGGNKKINVFSHVNKDEEDNKYLVLKSFLQSLPKMKQVINHEKLSF